MEEQYLSMSHSNNNNKKKLLNGVKICQFY